VTTFLQILFFAAAVGFAVYLYVRMPQLAGALGGRLLVLMALLALPLGLLQLGVTETLSQSTSREFCVSCHEMQVYETSLHLDHPDFMPAVHFQNNLVPQETACYTCHTDYTLFGDINAKLDGLKHVLVHYFGAVPEPGEIKLYRPYPNDNCLQCHRETRRFEEQSAHRTDDVTLAQLYDNSRSCLSNGCHQLAHEIKDIGREALWGEPRFPIPEQLLVEVDDDLDDLWGDDDDDDLDDPDGDDAPDDGDDGPPEGGDAGDGADAEGRPSAVPPAEGGELEAGGPANAADLAPGPAEEPAAGSDSDASADAPGAAVNDEEDP